MRDYGVKVSLGDAGIGRDELSLALKVEWALRPEDVAGTVAQIHTIRPAHALTFMVELRAARPQCSRVVPSNGVSGRSGSGG
ncbi:MAG: hypothetical protein IPN47_10435 [Gemmatimonadetes bacterium]|nr:hypothetical protein [Gemmatimonadota bacterium]